MATAPPAGFSSSLFGLPDQVLLAHTRSLVLHEQALQLAVLDHLREIHARHLHLRLGFSSLFDYAVRELGYSEGAAWRRIKAMRLCSDTAGSRERLQDGSLSPSAAAQLQNTFDLLQRTATAAADPGAAPAAPELLPGATGTPPEAGASGAAAAAPARPVPALDAAQRQELVAQASGKSTREVKQLLAGVAPELAPPADRIRALGEGRWELKVAIDSACQRGIEQLRALLSHVDPHLTLGQLVERLVQDGLQRYDPGRPPRGRRGRRREASAGQAPEPKAQQGPAGGVTSPAKRGVQEQPGVAPPPEGTSAGGSTPAPEALSVEEPACGIGRADTSAVAALSAPPAGRETCGGSIPVRAKPAAAAPGTAPSAAKLVAGCGSRASVPTPPAGQSMPTAPAAADRGRHAPSPAKRAGAAKPAGAAQRAGAAQLDGRSRPQAAAAGPSAGSAQPCTPMNIVHGRVGVAMASTRQRRPRAPVARRNDPDNLSPELDKTGIIGYSFHVVRMRCRDTVSFVRRTPQPRARLTALPASERQPRACRGHRRTSSALAAAASIAVLCTIPAPRVLAQDEQTWQGSVEVSPSTLTLAPGQSLSYRIRLTEAPTGDGWWVRLLVDGQVRDDGEYQGLSWSPSVGWGFNRDNWNQWRGILIRAHENVESGLHVTFTHEVWDHNSDCPVHNVGSVTLRITGTSQPATPALFIDDVTLAEDEGSALFTVSLSRQSSSTVTVSYETANGTADAGDDYSSRSGTLVFQPRETRKTITVPVLDDSNVEPSETFTVGLRGPTNATLADSRGTATITDDDTANPSPPPPPLPELSIGNATVAEDAGNAQFRVTLSRQSSDTVSVAYRTGDGSADVGSDYTHRNASLAFQPGETSLTIAVPVIDDADEEGNETFTVTLGDPQNATLRTAQGTATIIDNDTEASTQLRPPPQQQQQPPPPQPPPPQPPPQPPPGQQPPGQQPPGQQPPGQQPPGQQPPGQQPPGQQPPGQQPPEPQPPEPEPPPELAVDDVTVAEDGGNARFTVSLSRHSTVLVAVDFATSDGTARAGSDYRAFAGMLSFRPGETRKMLAVPVLDDHEDEADETFTVGLSNPRNATLADAEGTATITDVEYPGVSVSFGAAAYSVREGGFVQVAVELSTPPGRPLTIPLTHGPAGGAGENDYSGVPRSVRFAAADTRRSFLVAAEEDAEQDAGESVILGFGALPPRVAEAEPARSRVTIEDTTERVVQVPPEWLRQFAGAAAAHVVAALDGRLRCEPYRGPAEAAPDRRAPRWRCTPFPGPASLPLHGPAPDAPLAADSPAAVAAAELPEFLYPAAQREAGPTLSLWGRGSFSHFEDPRHAAATGGDVASAVLGADVLADRVLGGIALSHSQGDGTAAVDGVPAAVAASLTALHPYLRLGVAERVSLWGTLGLGYGTLTLTPPDGESLATDLGMQMAAAGAVAEIVAPTGGAGLAVALKADALVLRIDSGEAAPLAAAGADATRLRLVLEGAYEFVIAEGGWLAPFVDAGARFDGGAEEAGLGVEVGGGVRLADRVNHVTAALEAHVLLLHEVEDSERWSMSGSLRYDPSPESERGPYFTLSSSRQADAGGMESIAAAPVPASATAGLSLAAEVGYGIPVLDGSATGTPWVGMSLADASPEYRLGYRLAVGSDLHLGIVATLRDRTATNEPPDYAIVLLLSLR